MNDEVKKKSWIPFGDDPAFQALAFAAAFVPLAFFTGFYEKYETAKVGLFILCVAAALLIVALRRATLRYAKPFVGLLIAFVCWAGVASLFAADHWYAVFGQTPRFVGLVFFVSWAVFTALLAAQLDRRKLLYLAKVLTVDGALISILGIIQVFGITYYTQIANVGMLQRPPSFVGNADYAAMFLAAVLPLSFWVFSRAETFKFKMIWGLVVVLQLWGMAMFSSRGGLLAAGLELFALFMIAAIRRNKKDMSAVAAGAAIFAVLLLMFYPLMRSVSSENAVAISERQWVWGQAVQSIVHHPLAGIGPGGADWIIPNNTGMFDDMHNLFLQIGVIGGIPLLLAFLGSLLYPMVGAFRRLRKGDEYAGYGIVALLGLMAAASFSPVSIANWMMLGLLSAALVYPEVHESETIPRGIAGTVAALLFIYAVTFLASQLLLEYQVKIAEAQEPYAKQYKVIDWAFWLDPSSSMIADYRMEIAIKLNGPAGAAKSEAMIETYRRMHPSVPQTQIDAAGAYYDLSQLPDLPDANRLAAQAIAERDVEYGDEWMNSIVSAQLADQYLNEEDTSQAKTVLANGVEIMPTPDAHLWLLMARVYTASGNTAATIASLKNAYLVDPYDSLPLKHLLQHAAKMPSDATTYAATVQ